MSALDWLGVAGLACLAIGVLLGAWLRWEAWLVSGILAVCALIGAWLVRAFLRAERVDAHPLDGPFTVHDVPWPEGYEPMAEPFTPAQLAAFEAIRANVRRRAAKRDDTRGAA